MLFLSQLKRESFNKQNMRKPYKFIKNNNIWLILFGLYIFVFVKAIYFSHFGLNLFDYGESLHNAVRLLNGDRLYHDIWAIFPPADNYFPALVLFLFGKKLLVLRFAQSFLFALFIVVLTILLKNVLNWSMMILVLVALLFSNPNIHLLYFNLFFYLSILFLVYSLQRSKQYALFVSGIFLGLGSLFRHDTAIMGCGALIVSLVLIHFCMDRKSFHKELIKKCYTLIAGFLIITTPIILWMWKQNALVNFIYSAFVRAPNISKGLSFQFEFSFTPANLYQAFTLGMYAVFVFIYPLAIVFLFKELRERSKFDKSMIVLVVLMVMGIFQLPYAFSVFDMGHLVKGGVPALLIGGYLIQEATCEKRRVNILYYLPLVVFILGNVVASLWWIRFNDTLIRFPQGAVFVNSTHPSGTTKPTASTIISTVNFIKVNSKDNETIFVAPYHALFYFLTERKAPSRFNNFLAGYVSGEKEEREVVQSIDGSDVKVVVYDPVNAPFKIKMKDHNPIIHNYLLENFIVVDETPEGWLFMKKK